MTFQYNRTWDYHPIIIGDKRYDYDPSAEVPVPPDHEDHGKTVQQIVGASIITDAMIAEHKEKDTWQQMRVYRNQLLKECDWTQGVDVPDAIKTPYQTYRQSLRDITMAENTSDVIWPTKPS